MEQILPRSPQNHQPCQHLDCQSPEPRDNFYCLNHSACATLLPSPSKLMHSLTLRFHFCILPTEDLCLSKKLNCWAHTAEAYQVWQGHPEEHTGRCWDLRTCLGSSLYLSPVIKATCFPSCQDPCVRSISTSSQPARPLPCCVSNVETRVIRCISGKKQMELGSRENQALKPSRNTFQS